jgi:hypothetical protein
MDKFSYARHALMPLLIQKAVLLPDWSLVLLYELVQPLQMRLYYPDINSEYQHTGKVNTQSFIFNYVSQDILVEDSVKPDS